MKGRNKHNIDQTEEWLSGLDVKVEEYLHSDSKKKEIKIITSIFKTSET
jgi:hypothetical protein